MSASLTALTDELRRLKAAGVKSVAVSEESIAALRAAMSRRSEAKPDPTRPDEAPSAFASLRRDKSANSPSELSPSSPPDPTADSSRRSEAKPDSSRRSEAKADAKPAFPSPPTVTLPPGDKAARWASLHELVLSDPICRAHVRPGKKVVLGVGHLDAQIMFVGEAPGADEEVQGEPFVGPAGQLLNRMIAATGLKRADVYIGNIMNWRPEMPAGPDGVQFGNRPPTAGELAYCLPYLRAQIEIVNPALVVALGSTAAQGLLGAGAFKTLGEVRGKWHEFQGKPLMVTYHPSYILRNPTNRSKRMIWEDFLKVMTRAGLPISEKQQGYFLER